MPRWEFVSPLAGGANGIAAGRQFIHSDHIVQSAMWLSSDSTIFHYFPDTDGYAVLPSSGAGSMGSHTCGAASPWSTGATIGTSSLTASSGTTSTITTGQTLAKNLAGWPIHIVSGPNAGQTLTITSNTVGASAVITVPTQSVAFSNQTQFRLGTPRWYVLFATTGAPSFRVYDYATHTWTALSATGLPTWGGSGVNGESKLIATPSWAGTAYGSFATGTATSATSTTLVNSAKSWTSGQWVNCQIRITGGTGAGQIRTITANDATSVTVATWTVTPDNTSTYSIEGNDDFLYLMGNNAVTLYRYQISTNTWTTLSPVSARAGAPGSSGGMSASWIRAATDASWTNENSIINGRRIYSLRGGFSSALDYYDIAANTWVSGVTYSPTYGTQAPLFHAHIGSDIYCCWSSSTARPHWHVLNLITLELRPIAAMPVRDINRMPVATTNTVVGNHSFPVRFTDEVGNIFWFIYSVYPTGNNAPVMRYMVY